MVTRRDSGSLRKPVFRADGTARVDAYLTRAGVFTYLNADGTMRRELREPAQVFNADSLESFAGTPVTDDHPDGLVTAENARALARGAVGDTVRRDGNFVRARLTVLDAELIERMKAGKVEISCGYTCDLEHTPGTHPVFGPYDAKQTNIRGNHVAVVTSGRAGPEVRARMDAAGAAMVAGEPDREGGPMDTVKIKINGVEYDVAPQVAQAIEAERAPRADQARADAAAVESVRGELKAAQAQLASAQAEVTAAKDPAKFAAAVAARVELETVATAHTIKCDGLTDADIKRAVVKAVLKLDGLTDGEVEGAFKAARAAAGTVANAAVRTIVQDAATQGGSDTIDLDARRAAMIERNRNRTQESK